MMAGRPGDRRGSGGPTVGSRGAGAARPRRGAVLRIQDDDTPATPTTPTTPTTPKPPAAPGTTCPGVVAAGRHVVRGAPRADRLRGKARPT
jgi:hypothetical protein